MATIKYGTEEAEGVPLSQQSFGQQRSPVTKAPVPGPTFVPGVGTLGADLGGYVKGDMLAQEKRLKEHADARAEEQLGLQKEEFGLKKDYLSIAQAELGIKLENHANEMEEFGWKRDDRAKQKVIEAGMETAASEGGYEKVIDYLKTVDPNKAIEFHARKLSLDGAMLATDTMRAVSANEKSKAMVEGYSIIGKMGSALLKAAPEDRENLFKTMQPMLKSVLGEGAPRTLEEAVPVYMLSVAQATPQNMLFKSGKETAIMQSSIGKLDADIAAKIKAGATPETDVGLRDMINARSTYTSRLEQAEMAKASTTLQMQASQQQTATSKLNNTEKMQTSLNNVSKDFTKYMTDYVSVSGALKTLEKDPTNSAAQGIMATMMASSVQNGVLTDPDFSRTTQSNAGWKRMMENNLESWRSGKVVILAPDEISNLSQVFQDVTKLKVAAQKEREAQFRNTKVEGWGDILDKDKITYPSLVYDQMESQGKYERIIKQHGLGVLPPEMQQQAAEAIDQGVDPAAIKQYIQQQQQAKNQGRQQ